MGANDTVTRARPNAEHSTLVVSELSARYEATPRPQLQRGDLVGRYVIVDRVGQGGMGEVYRGYDPKLQREVALKRLRFGTDQPELSAEAESRLLREAQAMAQLSHPNVLPVYDIEARAGEFYIAMEYVAGQTLRAWLKRTPRPWREVLKRMLAAGEGLAAAHDRGLVHRDFKPTNVLLSSGGRTWVMDFGLARAIDAPEDPAGSHPARRPPDAAAEIAAGLSTQSVLSVDLTHCGTVMGTPAYMAPEQHRGLTATPLSDQFSFCVALFEALYGQRPFVVDKDEDLVHHKSAGRIVAPGGHAVPRWLDPIVRRGLEPDPEGRWASMHALLEQLAHDPSVGRRRWVAVAAGGLGVTAVGAWVAFGPTEPGPCDGAGHDVAALWTQGVRASMRARFSEVAPSYGADTFQRVARALDERFSKYTAEKTAACEATYVLHEQSAELLDRRMGCYARAHQQAAALLELWVDPDEELVRRAVQASTDLTPLARCADRERLLASDSGPGAAIAHEVAEVRRALATVAAQASAGRYAQAQQSLVGLVEDARRLGYAPLIVEALEQRGGLKVHQRDPEASVVLAEAFFAAMDHGLDALAADASRQLVVAVGRHEANLALGQLWARHSRSAARRGALGKDREAVLEYALAVMLEQHAQYDEALSHAQTALQIWTDAEGPEGHSVGTATNTIGVIQRRLGRFEESAFAFQRALEIWEDVLGPRHPDTASAMNNLAVALSGDGEPERAEELFRRSLEIRRAVLGEDHPDVARAWNNLGNIVHEQGRPREAREHLERAYKIWSAALGEQHHDTAMAMLNLGTIDEDLDAFDSAMQWYLRSVAATDGLAVGHSLLSTARHNVGALHVRRGEYEASLVHLEAALLGLQSDEGGTELRAQTRLVLAYALLRLGRDRARVEALAKHAAVELASVGASEAAIEDELREVVEALEQTRPLRSNGASPTAEGP